MCFDGQAAVDAVIYIETRPAANGMAAAVPRYAAPLTKEKGPEINVPGDVPKEPERIVVVDPKNCIEVPPRTMKSPNVDDERERNSPEGTHVGCPVG
jgi:hypothetical protein